MATPDHNRPLRLTRRVLGNRQNQSFPSLSALDRSFLEQQAKVGIGGSEPKPKKMTVKDLDAAMPLPVDKADSQLQQTTCSNSFWAEWADEMMTEENQQVHFDQVGLLRDSSSSTGGIVAPPSGGGGDLNTTSKSFTQSPLIMAPQLVMNSSMTSLSVMNVSVGTVRAACLEGEDSDGDLELLYDAMADSVAAQTLLEAQKYREAMLIYRKAIKAYVKVFDNENRVVAGVNAASCYRNMSTAARLLKQDSEAAECFNRAVAWYLKSHTLVTEQSKMSIVTLDGKNIDDSRRMSPNKSVSSMTDAVCIDSMLMEALQAQANFYMENERNVAGAFGAHDQALAHLVEINKLEQWKASTTTLLCRDGVVFTAPSQDQQLAWLLASLRALGGYYIKYEQFSDTPLGLYETGIDILQNRFEEQETKDDAMIHELASALRILSEIYFARQEHDLAADALHDSASIKLRASGEPSVDALRIMEKVGAANERAECYDKARSCYEQVMMARSKFYGTTNLTVAKALFDVGRVMEKKSGPTAESAEILRTANSILALDLTEGKPELRKNMEAILQLLPTIKHVDRSSQVVNDLDRSLSELHIRHLTTKPGPFDKAQIYFDLGRGFMLENNSFLAMSCLNEAMKEAKNCAQNDQAEALLRSMQVLDQQDESIDIGESLAGEAIELSESPQKPQLEKETAFSSVTDWSATKPVAFSSSDTVFSDPAFFCHNSSVFHENDPSIHIFEDPPSENVCIQPILRNQQRGVTTSMPSKDRSMTAQSLNNIPIRETMSASDQQSREKPIWHRLFCNIWATVKPVERPARLMENLTEKLTENSVDHESLVPIVGSQNRAKQQVETKDKVVNHTAGTKHQARTTQQARTKHRSNPLGRTTLGLKLYTIPESKSLGNESQETAGQCLLNSSTQSQETSSGMGTMQKQAISYTMMGRKHYAAV